jgi:hypothetical protein
MSSPDLEKKQSLYNTVKIETGSVEARNVDAEETLHRGLKARQVSRSFPFRSLDLYLE